MDRNVKLSTLYHEVWDETLSIRVDDRQSTVAMLILFVVGSLKGLGFFIALPFIAVAGIVLALLHRPAKGLVALCRRVIRK
jgi:hypothetical protein